MVAGGGGGTTAGGTVGSAAIVDGGATVCEEAVDSRAEVVVSWAADVSTGTDVSAGVVDCRGRVTIIGLGVVCVVADDS